ncbi:MAG: hypothetical protein RJP95_00390 [Pirellulales bacterium]
MFISSIVRTELDTGTYLGRPRIGALRLCTEGQLTEPQLVRRVFAARLVFLEAHTNLGCGRTHAAALLRAELAFFGALLTVIGFVLLALFCASLADFGKHAADLLGELRAPAHQRGCGPTHLGAIAIQSNAFSHLGKLSTRETGIGTVLTILGTANTLFNTGLVLVV